MATRLVAVISIPALRTYRTLSCGTLLVAMMACSSPPRTASSAPIASDDAPSAIAPAEDRPLGDAGGTATERDGANVAQLPPQSTAAEKKSGASAEPSTGSPWPPALPPEPDEVATPSAPHGVADAARSPSIAPPPWDPAAYRRDPQAYLADAFPGRVHETAQPAADVPFLIADGPTGFSVLPLGRVVLRVIGEPWMPVTFTSWGLGSFLRTGLTTVTVPADGEGRAVATWVATKGTTGSVLLVAGSPTRAGQVSFLIQIAE